MNRERYGFTQQAKRYMHIEQDRNCMGSDGCQNDNDLHIHHLSGCYVSALKDLEPDAITDPEQNALMLCPDHREALDWQERVHIDMVKQDAGIVDVVEVEPVWIDENRAAVFLPNEGTIIFKR